MTKSKFRLPHDPLFKKAMENPLVARSFFESHLPHEVKNIVDLSTLTIEKESFIDQSLKNSICDLLFSVKYEQDKKGYIFILLEHQSRPHYLMAFRLFKYMIGICDKHLSQNPKSKEFPLIYPVVFYNGKQKYNAPRNLWDLFENKNLAKALWTRDYDLINLQEIPDEELQNDIWAGTMQFFMKHIFERNLLKAWETIANKLPEIARFESGHNYIKILLTYTLTKMEEDDKMELQNLFSSNLEQEEGENIMVSIAQKLFEEGWEKGEEKGKAEGKFQIAMNLLKLKQLSVEDISKVTGISVREIQKIAKLSPRKGKYHSTSL